MDNTLQIMRDFVAQFPDWDILSSLTIDYTDQVPDCAGLFPNGMVELSRHKDILGRVWARNQYNFALYTNMAKSPDEDEGATFNADWMVGFQEWVQRQSILGLAPTFGDLPREEAITAQNGAIYSVDDEGTALYVVQINVTYTTIYN